ncbi:ribonuclease H [Senna tora]|uniref:Ribonuclease H n=1 Tax=Senna tora TaxID=362788 RepID=A0A834WGJ7_9FABA|nr:ribonuclease H [Senna tora]
MEFSATPLQPSQLPETGQPPGWPPDNANKNDTTMNDAAMPQSSQTSFKDKLMGKKKYKPKIPEDLIKKELVSIDWVDGNKALPKISFASNIIEELSKVWENTIIVSLLGREVGYKYLHERLKKLWRMNGTMEMVDIGHGFFQIQFSDVEDMLIAMADGPWVILDHYLTMRQWTPDFQPSTATTSETLAWVRFPELNMVYYEENVLMAIASAIGTPIKVDSNTLDAARGRFARVCVEVDLSKPLVGKILIGGNWIKVEYESLHNLCVQCGVHGHAPVNCPRKTQSTTTPAAANDKQDASTSNAHFGNITSDGIAGVNGGASSGLVNDAVGDWMVVTKKRRNGKKKLADTEASKGKQNFNQFHILQDMVTDQGRTNNVAPTINATHHVSTAKATRAGKNKRLRADKDHHEGPSITKEATLKAQPSMPYPNGPSTISNTRREPNNNKKSLPKPNHMSNQIRNGPTLNGPVVVQPSPNPLTSQRGQALTVHATKNPSSNDNQQTIFKAREKIWLQLSALKGKINGPWLMMGDFNDILYPSEVNGGSFYQGRANKFADMMNNCDLMDLDCKGPKFTWRRNCKNNIKVSKRLDRALANADWRIHFAEASVHNLFNSYSDHNPIGLFCRDNHPSKQDRPFRFEAAWAHHPGFYNVVKFAWESCVQNVPLRLSTVKSHALWFNKNVFGNIFQRKKKLKARLNGIQKSLDNSPSTFLTNLQRDLRKQLEETLAQEELLWFQKSREQWVKFDDGAPMTHITIHNHPKINEQDALNITGEVTKEEVWNAVKTMKAFKAPGPDGFQPFFFKQYWDVVGNAVTDLVKSAFRDGPQV